MRLRTLVASLILAGASALPAAAHEFWISPEAYQVEAGGTITAAIRVGSDFEGSSYSYIPDNFRRFDLVQGDTVVPVEGRIGDRPALAMAAPGDGLWTVVHVTTDTQLKYKDWDTFVGFTEHKDVTWAQERHVARGLSMDNVREQYSRYGKSLVGVGDAAGQDVRVGLLIEIVAEANPYTAALSEMPVQVFHDGAVRAGSQVEVYSRAPEGAVSVTRYRTDAEGRVSFPVEAGHEYLVDSVVLREIESGTETGPAWESLWASLTFRMPG
ncbi:DUF4198 domain-containing protein [Anianabacter salinae]|uniref:DUF4198 domain-containing protein n=1 Tax=Anianabacter salinae TaxID=2851023 RepID=UPI00225E5F86|nr:DUF4198 domain-containing protein [Anianabacter salinae]MBV0912626.1 DUF4198 domain-containing protein [Anianabacter salinae]